MDVDFEGAVEAAACDASLACMAFDELEMGLIIVSSTPSIGTMAGNDGRKQMKFSSWHRYSVGADDSRGEFKFSQGFAAVRFECHASMQ